MPCCGIPARATTGFGVGGGALESFLEITATAMSATAAAIATPNARTTERREGRFVEPGFIAAIVARQCAHGVSPRAFGAGYTGRYTS